MKHFILALSSVLFFSQIGAADVLQVVAGSQNCEGVTIPQSATLTLPDRQVGLTTVGYGLRKKKVAIVNVKVYCTTILVSDPANFKRSDAALQSLDGMQANALRLDFVRSVDAQTVKSSFQDALAANNVDTSTPSMQGFLNAVANGGAAESGKALTIAVDEKNGILVYQDNNGNTTNVQGDAKFLHDVLSIWFGVPADDGLAALKKQLIGN